MTQISDPKSKVETDEEILEKAGQASHEGLTENEEIMVDVVVQASMPGAPFPASSTVGTYEETLATKAQVQVDAPVTDAATDIATA